MAITVAPSLNSLREISKPILILAPVINAVRPFMLAVWLRLVQFKAAHGGQK